MIKVRNKQLNSIQEAKKTQFIEKAHLFIKTNYPLKIKKFSEQEIIQNIKAGMVRAKQYNLLSEKAMIAFIELTLILTNNFDTNPKTDWTQQILSDLHLTESQKINTIINNLNLS